MPNLRFNSLSSAGLGWLALIHLTMLGGLVGIATLAAMPIHTIPMADDTRAAIMSLIPEGWGFFTKNPREPEMQIATLRDGTMQNLNIVSSFQFRYAFGLNRQPRSQGRELDQLLKQLRDVRLWHNCQTSTVVCAQKLHVQKRIINTVNPATLCGNLVLFERGPVPWAYRHIKSKENMPSRLTRVEVLC